MDSNKRIRISTQDDQLSYYHHQQAQDERLRTPLRHLQEPLQPPPLPLPLPVFHSPPVSYPFPTPFPFYPQASLEHVVDASPLVNHPALTFAAANTPQPSK